MAILQMSVIPKERKSFPSMGVLSSNCSQSSLVVSTAGSTLNPLTSHTLSVSLLFQQLRENMKDLDQIHHTLLAKLGSVEHADAGCIVQDKLSTVDTGHIVYDIVETEKRELKGVDYTLQDKLGAVDTGHAVQDIVEAGQSDQSGHTGHSGHSDQPGESDELGQLYQGDPLVTLQPIQTSELEESTPSVEFSSPLAPVGQESPLTEVSQENTVLETSVETGTGCDNTNEVEDSSAPLDSTLFSTGDQTLLQDSKDEIQDRYQSEVQESIHHDRSQSEAQKSYHDDLQDRSESEAQESIHDELQDRSQSEAQMSIICNELQEQREAQDSIQDRIHNAFEESSENGNDTRTEKSQAQPNQKTSGVIDSRLSTVKMTSGIVPGSSRSVPSISMPALAKPAGHGVKVPASSSLPVLHRSVV